MWIKTVRGWKRLQPVKHKWASPIYVPTWAEANGLKKGESCAEQYSFAVQRFLLPRILRNGRFEPHPNSITEERMMSVLGSKNVNLQFVLESRVLLGSFVEAKDVIEVS